MPITLTMPALSPTMEEGKLAKWLVREGDQIKAGAVIAEIETDKATMEFEAPESGVLARIVVPDGTENVAVNTLIAILAAEGEDPKLALAGAQASAAAQAVTPMAAAPVEAATQRGEGGRVWASPLARRIATQQGLDLSQLVGTGPGGRIVRQDVETALAARPAEAVSVAPVTAAAPAPTAASAAAPAAGVGGLYPPGSYEVVELDNMRRTIARRLTESKQTVPHFYLRTDVELDAVLALQAQLNAAAPKTANDMAAYKITVNDLVIKALACALRDVPDGNVTWADGKMLRHKAVDVAVAVAIEGGLITPIIRDADKKSISAISNTMKDLARRARTRKLAPEEYQGGSTSVSNLGMFGVKSFDAVINPPHGTILAVGAGEKRAVVRGAELAVATVMTVTLSVDHRVVDGAVGAQLLATLKRSLEDPLSLIV